MAVAGMRVTDCHVHVHPWREMRPDIVALMRGSLADAERVEAMMYDPRLLLALMDEQGIARVGLVNYPAPEVMGTNIDTIMHAARYAEADPRRLLWYGGVHPRHAKDPAGEVDALADAGMRMLKVHPNHQEMPANAYADGLATQALAEGRKVDREALGELFVETIVSTANFNDALARETLGRSTIHVLLLHETDLNALFVPDLVDGLRADGWQIVTIDEAYADPLAQVEPDTLYLGGGRVTALAAAAGRDPVTLVHPRTDEAELARLFEERVIVREDQ